MAYIKKEDVVKAMNKAHQDRTWSMSDTDVMELMEEYVEALPTADVVEVVHGEWIDDKHNRARKICSICFNSRPRENDHEFRSETNYCPNCGALMDGGSGK